MIKRQRSFSILLLVIAFLGVTDRLYSQELDIWSGNYILRSPDAEVLDTICIEMVTGDKEKDKGELIHWQILSLMPDNKDSVRARAFVFNDTDGRNEYEEFGWTELYLKNEMSCLDMGHIFICQTKPNSTVNIDKESFFTKTGIFGIRLHYGLFSLEKI